jgi:hypothetical protein
VSLSTRKQPVSMNEVLRYRAAQAGGQVGTLAGKAMPFAQQAMPLAQTAGTTVRQGAGTAMSKTTPVVEAARSWAAPQLEQSAHAISETIAPMISNALMTAAHKIEVPKPRQRSNRALVAGAMVLTAAAGAAAAAAVRMRRNSGANGAVTVTTEQVRAETEPPPDPDMDGRTRIV